MKKIISLFYLIGLLMVNSCSFDNPVDPDNQQESIQVYNAQRLELIDNAKNLLIGNMQF